MKTKSNLSKLPANERSLAFAGIIGMAMLTECRVEFNYDGKRRVVEPHALGLSTKDSSVVMRGYQTEGEASRPLPQWTLFSVNKIDEIKVYDEHTSLAPRDGYKMGDKQMSPVLIELDVS